MSHDEFTKLFKAVMRIDQRLSVVEEDVTYSRTQVDTILNRQDSFLERLETGEIERAAQNQQLDRHDEALENHTQRITRLEQA